MRTNTSRMNRALILVLLSVSMLASAACSKDSGAAITKLPVPQILRGNAADPTHLDLDKRFGAVAVELRLDEGAQKRLGTKALPGATASVAVSLSGGSLASPINVTVYSDEFVNGVAQFVATNLPSGTITVSATVKDAGNTTLASGSQSATVIVGQITPVNLLLTTSSATGSGAVSLLVDTRPSATPSPSASVLHGSLEYA